ncbi:MAG: GatB/YqeY domain-containing protein [Candidatus Margulisbacteria bacterium]|nr:GatB/YqeY domain-containing protein [Candidatus Margulisiibacteriota bacterium]
MANFIEKLNDGIKSSMKDKDQFRLNVLRMMKSKIMLVNARGEVDEGEAVKIVKKYAKSLKETITVAEEHSKTEAAEQAKKELTIVEEFLPEEMSEEQVKVKAEEIIAGLDDSAKGNFGKVMGACMKGIQGADGAVVKKIVNELLKN